MIIGHKKEMTQIFSEDGKVVPVTIVDVNNVYIAGIKTAEKDGYKCVVLGKDKKKNFTKAEAGKFKELGFVPKYVKENRLENDVTSEDKIGDEVKASIFELNQKVDVTGISKGKGFQGVVKRWGFAGGPKTHGQSDRHRAPGSIGSGTTPGRVYKGKKMGGRMGGDQKTVQNLKIALIDDENGLIAIKGAIPGNKGSLVIIKAA